MKKYRKTIKNLDRSKYNKKTRKYRKHGGTTKTYTPYTFDPISNGEIVAFLLIDLHRPKRKMRQKCIKNKCLI